MTRKNACVAFGSIKGMVPGGLCLSVKESFIFILLALAARLSFRVIVAWHTRTGSAFRATGDLRPSSTVVKVARSFSSQFVGAVLNGETERERERGGRGRWRRWLLSKAEK